MIRRAHSGTVLALALLGTVALVTGSCTTSTTTGTPTPPGSAQPSAGTGASGPTPRPTAWPVRVISSVIALGGVDGEVEKASSDLTAAVDREDPAALLAASSGLARLMDESIPNAQEVAGYPGTAALGERWLAALQEVRAGAVELRDALSAGRSEQVGPAVVRVSSAIAQYRRLRPAITEAVDQAVLMRRMLVL